MSDVTYTPEEQLENSQELTELKNKNAFSLPDNPSQQGMSSANIKKKMYEGEFYLLNKIQEERKSRSDYDDTFSDWAGQVTEDISSLENEVAQRAYKTRKIAGIDLEDDISVNELKQALSLDNVNNTSDSNKPISNATQNALNTKADIDDLLIISSYDGTLTDEQYAYVQKKNARIRDYQYIYYEKSNEDGNNIYFTSTKFTLIESNDLAVIKHTIVISKASKYYYLDTPGLSLYSTYQLNALLATKQDNLTFDNSPTANSNNPVKSSGIYNAIQNVLNVANGKTGTYSIENNPIFKSNLDIVRVNPNTDETYFTTLEGIDIYYSELNIGDVILVAEKNYPDRWFAGTSDDEYLFYPLESRKVDLTPYMLKADAVSNVDYDGTNKKITKTINGVTTDVLNLGYTSGKLVIGSVEIPIKIENGTITIGENSITPITSHQSLDGKLDKYTETPIIPLVYGVNASGTQGMFEAIDEVLPSTIVMRDANGRASINDPVSGGNIANKNYVDSNLPTIIRG